MKKYRKSVDEIIDTLPPDEKVIVRKLRSIVQECLPKAIEKNSYGVPYYGRNRMICFIWPPSLQWGSKTYTVQSKGVTLGFCQGNLFANEDRVLLPEGRKQVYCIYFKSLAEIQETQVRALLFEADLIDQGFDHVQKKRPMS